MQLRRDAADVLRQRAIDLDRDADGDSETVTANEKQVTISRRFKEKVVQPILKRHFGRDEFLGVNAMKLFPFVTYIACSNLRNENLVLSNAFYSKTFYIFYTEWKGVGSRKDRERERQRETERE